MIGQHNPEQPVNREPLALIAYYLDGTENGFKWRSSAQFINCWNKLDHPNVISIVLLQKGSYGVRYQGKAEETRHYRSVVFTNDPETTYYWLDSTGYEIQDGNSVDIPPGAHAYPKNERSSTINIDNKAGRNYNDIPA